MRCLALCSFLQFDSELKAVRDHPALDTSEALEQELSSITRLLGSGSSIDLARQVASSLVPCPGLQLLSRSSTPSSPLLPLGFFAPGATCLATSCCPAVWRALYA